jgi:VanZ family protein
MTDNLQQPLRLASWGIAVAILTLSFVPPSLRPETGAPSLIEHFFIYLACGTAFGVSYSRKRGFLTIFFAIFAGLVEAAQYFVPGRHARVSDFVVDALAMYIGLLATLLAERCFDRPVLAFVPIATRRRNLSGSKEDKEIEH